MEYKILDKNLYWTMNDKNHCIGDYTKYSEFIEKTSDIREIFDRILNHLFNTKDEVINYLYYEGRVSESLAVTAYYNGYRTQKEYYPINNSYFIGLNYKNAKRVDLKNNNVIAFVANITNSTKIEVYLSEVNFHKYCYKINKIVPVIVFNLPEYAQTIIYREFQSAFSRLLMKTKCKTPYIYLTFFIVYFHRLSNSYIAFLKYLPFYK